MQVAYRYDAASHLVRRTFNRYCASGIGRFTSPDPYSGSAALGDPQSWNRYSYVQGDPVNLSDPDGLNADPCRDAVESAGNSYCLFKRDGGFDVSLRLVSWFGSETWGHRVMTVLNPIPAAGAVRGSPAPRPECDTANEKNRNYLNFIGAHGSDAQKLAAQLAVTAQDVLGVAIHESGFGTSRVALQGNSFFGIHAPKSPFAGQTGTITTRADGKMAAFSKATGFYDSGAAFMQLEAPYVKGVADPKQFAEILHQHGYGVTNAKYVGDLVNIISNVAIRLDCPK